MIFISFHRDQYYSRAPSCPAAVLGPQATYNFSAIISCEWGHRMYIDTVRVFILCRSLYGNTPLIRLMPWHTAVFISPCPKKVMSQAGIFMDWEAGEIIRLARVSSIRENQGKKFFSGKSGNFVES